MNNDQNSPDEKLYYSIGEVSERLGLSASLLRFWEKEFELATRKNSKGNRIYTRDDILKLETIRELVKDKGMTLQGAKNMLAEKHKPDDKKREAVAVLKKLRNFLTEMKRESGQ